MLKSRNERCSADIHLTQLNISRTMADRRMPVFTTMKKMLMVKLDYKSSLFFTDDFNKIIFYFVD